MTSEFDESASEIVQIPTLKQNDWMSLMLGFFWRILAFGIAASIIAGILGAVIGGVIGGVLGFIGVPIEVISVIGMMIGIVLGAVVSFAGQRAFIPWFLNGRFGNFRLQLVRAK